MGTAKGELPLRRRRPQDSMYTVGSAAATVAAIGPAGSTGGPFRADRPAPAHRWSHLAMTFSGRDHPAVKIMPPDPDPRVEIDVRMVGLILECWRLGLATRFCCQGDPHLEAYITFGAPWQALLFAAAAGPMAWDTRTHRRRERENPPGEPWRWSWWRWTLEGATVRFPTRDIPRAEKQLRCYGALLPARIGADTAPTDPRLSAPRTCPTCGGIVLARRRDARFCSRRCQLAARRRRST
jgi:hypothetical protein